jgi:hypothetical protein
MKYKVGQRVRIKSLDWYNGNKDKYGAIYAGCGFVFWNYMAGFCGEIMTIASVKVDPENPNNGYYFMENKKERWTDEMIEGLVEEETKPNIIEEAKTYWDSIKDAWICPDGYIFKDESGNIINTTKIVLEKKKEYPKTYEECLKIMGIKFNDCYIQGYKSPLLEDLQELLICRDAYWKIAGEEVGLDKSWKPDWEGEGWYVIINHRGDIVTDVQWHANAILAFPTEEMRDAFYENFKELIEQCKELL